jgi:hypothetical protein
VIRNTPRAAARTVTGAIALLVGVGGGVFGGVYFIPIRAKIPGPVISVLIALPDEVSTNLPGSRVHDPSWYEATKSV